jgi:hypothetical protein
MVNASLNFEIGRHRNDERLAGSERHRVANDSPDDLHVDPLALGAPTASVRGWRRLVGRWADA